MYSKLCCKIHLKVYLSPLVLKFVTNVSAGCTSQFNFELGFQKR